MSGDPSTSGWQDVADQHQVAVQAGSNAPFWITEVGQCMQAGSGGPNCTPIPEDQVVDDLDTYLNDSYADSWVAGIFWYTDRDDPNIGAFGLLNNDNSPRQAFAAMQDWVAAHGDPAPRTSRATPATSTTTNTSTTSATGTAATAAVTQPQAKSPAVTLSNPPSTQQTAPLTGGRIS